MTLIYAVRVDATAAITVWPAWIGGGFGLILALFASQWRRWLALAWLGFAFVFVDEARSVPRMVLPAPTSHFRVVTLNCAGGSFAAAEAVIPLKPDVVFLQESPNRKEVEALAKKLYGDEASFAYGIDASIIARGELLFLGWPVHPNFTLAIWRPTPDRSLTVVSLRLAPPVMRIDLYSPSAWEEFAANRHQRREEVAEVASTIADLGTKPGIVGGDFNTPPDAGVQRPLVEGLADAFARAGVGYGATCVHPYPCLVRIDQIWHSPDVQAVRSWTVATEHSDHRMVAADFKWVTGSRHQ